MSLLGKVILILEDEPLIALSVMDAVGDEGGRPIHALSVQEAFGALDTRGIDAAILDVTLRGGATCGPVAKRLAERGTPFIYHSGDYAFNRGALPEAKAVVVQKPASNRTLIGALERALED